MIIRIPRAGLAILRGVLIEAFFAVLLGAMLGAGVRFRETVSSLEKRILSMEETARSR